jgi:Domain of unknown function (DUF4333)
MSLALAGVGCGHGSSAPGESAETAPETAQELTPTKVESQITELQQHSGIQPESVHCPSDVKIQNGHTFKCVTTLTKGAPITTTVKPTNRRLGEAEYDFFLPPGT